MKTIRPKFFFFAQFGHMLCCRSLYCVFLPVLCTLASCSYNPDLNPSFINFFHFFLKKDSNPMFTPVISLLRMCHMFLNLCYCFLTIVTVFVSVLSLSCLHLMLFSPYAYNFQCAILQKEVFQECIYIYHIRAETPVF